MGLTQSSVKWVHWVLFKGEKRLRLEATNLYLVPRLRMPKPYLLNGVVHGQFETLVNHVPSDNKRGTQTDGV